MTWKPGMQNGIFLRKVKFAVIVLIAGAAIAIPLGRYADRDDAPGGVVIAFLAFIAAALLAAWMVKRTETWHNLRNDDAILGARPALLTREQTARDRARAEQRQQPGADEPGMTDVNPRGDQRFDLRFRLMH
jgi:hypothetical protein